TETRSHPECYGMVCHCCPPRRKTDRHIMPRVCQPGRDQAHFTAVVSTSGANSVGTDRFEPNGEFFQVTVDDVVYRESAACSVGLKEKEEDCARAYAHLRRRTRPPKPT